MLTHNGRVSIHQVRLILILQMFSVSVLILPRITAIEAGQDGWILPICALLFGSVYVWIITTLTGQFRGETFVEIVCKVLNRPVGIGISFLFALKLMISTGLELRMFGEMISQVLLPHTPVQVIVLVMLLTCAYLVKSGVEAIGRMAEILVFFVFVPLIIVLSFIVVKADYNQVLPIFQASTFEIFKGGYYVSLSFMPLEFMLMLIGLMSKPEKARNTCLWAIGIITVVEVVIIVMTYTGVGVMETKRSIWPVLALMQSIQFPGSIMENQEILMMTCWVMSIYMYICGGLYFSSLIISRARGFKRENICVLPLIPLIYFIAMGSRSLVKTYEFFTIFQRTFGIWFLIIVPAVLLAFSRVKKVGDDYEEN